jgi:pimeloyl-ACP methyl ester carboxylesterase
VLGAIIETDLVKLTYTDAGSGPAVILLHGYPFDRSMWREQIDVLSTNGFRVVAPDLRGFGATVSRDSSTPNHKLKSVPLNKAFPNISSMDDMARDVLALMDQLKIDRAAMCGLSMGGYVAFEFVRLFPSRVRALVLAGTRAPADNETEKLARAHQVEEMLAKGMNGIAEATLSKLLAREPSLRNPKSSLRSVR